MPQFGQWDTFSFKLPDFLETTRSSLSTVVDVVTSSLQVALSALEIVKTFTQSFDDPAQILLNALLEQISSIANDFRKIGIFVTGDYNLLSYPFDSLRGGFDAYQRRMIGRLTDQSDPTRPNISSNRDVFALFLYLSVPTEEIATLINFLRSMTGLFNIPINTTTPLPIPSITGNVLYGAKSTGPFTALSNFSQLSSTPPNVAKLVWKVTPKPSGGSPVTSPIPPGGFMITVSTIPDGIPLHYSRPQGNTNKKLPTSDTDTVQPREYGQVKDAQGNPITLYGGYESYVKAPSYNQTIDSNGMLKDGASQIYGLVSNGIIPLDLLKDGDKYYFQRTFFLTSKATGPQWPTEEYHFALPLSEMPHHAEVSIGNDGKATITDLGTPNTFYVRIATVPKEIADGTNTFKYDFSTVRTQGALSGQPFIITHTDGYQPDSISRFSSPRTVAYPNSNTIQFLDSLTSALILLALSRSDLPVSDKTVTRATGFESYAYLLDLMFPPNGYKAFIESKGRDPVRFRQELLRRAQSVAQDIYDSVSPDIQALTVRLTENLRTVDMQTILSEVGERQMAAKLKSLQLSSTLIGLCDATKPDQAELTQIRQWIQNGAQGLPPTPTVGLGGIKDVGIAANPYSAEIPSEQVGNLFSWPKLLRFRAPDFYEYGKGTDFKPRFEIPAQDAEIALALANPSARIFYERHVQADGSIVIPNETADYIRALQSASTRTVGSIDLSPVFYLGSMQMRKLSPIPGSMSPQGIGMVFLRSVFRQFRGGLLYTEAAQVLGIAASVLSKSQAEGSWIAVRLFDSFPDVEGFFDGIQSWLQAGSSAAEGFSAVLQKYIDFVESRITELQQLIDRVNAQIQNILRYTLDLPAFSSLFVLARGTNGVVQALASAEEKPTDSPESYGAGVCLVIPSLPSSLLSLLAG